MRRGAPGQLVALGVVHSAKKGLAQQAVGVILLLKLPWAVLLRLRAGVGRGPGGAAPAHVDPAATGLSTEATAIGLSVGSVARESSERHHGVLAGGGQQGTSRESQVCGMFLLRPGPPQAEGDEGDDDEDDGAQDDADDQVGQVAGAGHHGPGAHRPLYGFRGWRLRWGHCWGRESTGLARRLAGFGLADHHVAELALASCVEALHLNVIGGLWLQVADRVPVSCLPSPWRLLIFR